MHRPAYSVVVGCGRLGSRLASRLSKNGHDVVVIDSQESSFKSLTTDFSGFCLVGNAAELDTLEQAKAKRADNLLAVTGDDNLNVMIAQAARIVFEVETVLVRIIDPDREAVYQELGLVTVSPTPLVENAFFEKLEGLIQPCKV